MGLLWAALGMAIGTGNIWRFPRMAAKYGGGAYILAWLLGLFLWSFPLLLIEAGIGRCTNKGVLGAFYKAAGERSVIPGVLITLITAFITFYYSVVTGWCAGYLAHTTIAGLSFDPLQFWQHFEGSTESWIWTVVVVVLTGFIVARGIQAGIERFTKSLIPIMFFILILLVLYAASLSYSGPGFDRVFHLHLTDFKSASLWVDAFSQSAWSTGAGWGLYLTYMAYAAQDEDIEHLTFATGFGNNLASVLAASAIIPMIVTLLPQSQANSLLSSGNTGLAFIAMPMALHRLGPYIGWGFGVLFFSALLVAAMSSLVSMYEMLVVIIRDFGISRKKGVWFVTAAVLVFATPSALWPAFFANQDWVWGIALLLSGVLFLIPFMLKGPKRFMLEYLFDLGPITTNLVYHGAIITVPIIGIGLLLWYIISTALSKNAWSLHNPYSLTYVLLEWAAAVILAYIIGKLAIKRFKRQ